MGAAADLLDLVARGHVERDAAAVDAGHLGFGRYVVPTGVAAKWRTSTAVPTALSPGSR